MNTLEFLEKYGWWKPIYYNPAKCEKRWNGRYDKRGCRQVQTYVYCECSVCHEEDWVRWAPDIVSNTIKDRSLGEKGYYICSSCRDQSLYISKHLQNTTFEDRHESAEKMIRTKKENDFWHSENYISARKKVYSDQVENDTWMKEQELKYIISTYGGYHLPSTLCYPGTDIAFAYEADWIDLSKKIIIEIDTPDHENKESGYHVKKRQYFIDRGFRVLNIAVNRKEKKCVHPRRPGVTYTQLLEMFINNTESFPTEWEILWDDPWYVNG